jgi:arylsulfatase A-like enzyme
MYRRVALPFAVLVSVVIGFGLARDDPPVAAPALSTMPSSSTMLTLSTVPTLSTSSTVSTVSTMPAVRPNIVFVLADDLDSGLVQYMPKLTELVQASGVSFTNYYVTSAVCCPSRVSMLRGQYPHNTTVLTNEDGFAKFYQLGLESSTIATWLQSAGYGTALMGKYLNGYLEARGAGLFEYVPPGWTEWDVAGDGFREVDYTMNHNGTLTKYGHSPGDVLTDVLRARADAFITKSTDAGQPFFLELATFAPHFPYTVLDRYANMFPGITAPRPPSFNARGQGEPKWLAAQPSLTTADIATLDAKYRRRAQAVQSIDELIGHVFESLQRTGALDNTYFVFSSDNGYHVGQHRLQPGKQTAYDSDIRVPLIVGGPGIARGSVDAMTMNIDLAPTFASLAGVPTPAFVDGRSLVPLLKGTTPTDWREVVLVEHEGPTAVPGDPDYQPDDNPTRYAAIRSAKRLFVEYHSGEYELYDYVTDPHELSNRAASLSASELSNYQRTLDVLRECRAETCRAPARI